MIKIPKKAFELKSEGGDSVLPEVGDEVPLEGFTGTVKADDGDSFVIDLQSYNGEPVTYEDAKEEEGADNNPDDKEKADLLEMMSKGSSEE